MFNYKKSLGQHFLHDNSIIEKIIDQVLNQKSTQVLEVGPGGGALTKHLVNQSFDFKAVEIDREKIEYLKKTYPAIQLIEEDFLNLEKPFSENFMVVGNFPYNISTQIIFKILDWKENVTCIIGMFQKEVAQRIASKNNSKHFGILSVVAQMYYDIEYLFDVAPTCFTPPPNVMSGVIKLTVKNNFPNVDYKKLLKFTKAAFSQRRKTLRNSLSQIIPKEKLADDIFNKRAEQLELEDFVQLTNQFL